MPAAWEIIVAETIALLEANFPGLTDAVARGSYALWLGSGISLDRVVGVPAVIGRIIEYLRSRRDATDPTCRFNVALTQVLANLSTPEREKLHLDLPLDDWPEADRRAITSRLAGFYAEVLETPLEGEAEADFLLWTAVDVPGSFTGDEPDVEHLCVVMLTLEGAFRDITSANWDYLIESRARRSRRSPRIAQADRARFVRSALMMHQLTELVVSDFRSIKGTVTIPLDAPIVLIHGPNGVGKTSIATAIELALTGDIAPGSSWRKASPRGQWKPIPRDQAAGSRLRSPVSRGSSPI